MKYQRGASEINVLPSVMTSTTSGSRGHISTVCYVFPFDLGAQIDFFGYNNSL